MKAGEKRKCKMPTGEIVVVELLYEKPIGGVLGWMVRQCDTRSVYRVSLAELGDLA